MTSPRSTGASGEPSPKPRSPWPSTPFDDRPWTTQLTARVVAPGAAPRLHGYDCEADLARHASVGDGMLLALTGELPDERQSRAFALAIQFIAPISIAEAPAHAAVLARVCAAPTSGIIGTATVALAEQARHIVASLSPAWSWLKQPSGEVPVEVRSQNDDDRRSVDRLRAALRATGLEVPALAHDLARTPALVAVLLACGLPGPQHVEAAWVLARLPVAFAEAMAAPPASFLEYPWHVPPFRYEEDSHDR